ncbi:MAG: response regulator [Pseudomonadota bacterium]
MHAAIVDDFLEDRFFLKHALSILEKGVTVEEFAYAEEALKRVLDEAAPAFDVLFVDINMMRMDGFAFVNAYVDGMQPDRPPGRIFLVSGTFDQRDIERAETHPHVAALVSKPVSVDALREAIS